jgi:hypothetical protein
VRERERERERERASEAVSERGGAGRQARDGLHWIVHFSSEGRELADPWALYAECAQSPAPRPKPLPQPQRPPPLSRSAPPRRRGR